MLGLGPPKRFYRVLNFIAYVCGLLTRVLVWSNIVARRVWRQARSPQGINKARAKLDKVVGRFFFSNGGVVVHHRDLEVVDDGLLRPDGVHLNAMGSDIWMLALQEGIEQDLRLWRD